MIIRSKTVAFLLVTLLAACAHGGTVPTRSNQTMQTNSTSTSSASAVTTGNFTEYRLPAGVHPSDLTHGPYATLYFSGASQPAKVYQMLKTTGVMHFYTAGFVPGENPPVLFSNYVSSIFSAGRAVWFVVIDTQHQNQGFIARVTPEGVFSYYDVGPEGCYTNITQGADGRIWFGFSDDCGFIPNTLIESRSTSGIAGPFVYVPNAIGHFITPGPGGNLYLTAIIALEAHVYVISTAGIVLHKFALPVLSHPAGIVTGSDHNLWIAEPDINKIARMTPAGAVTQYALPTANASPDQITSGVDNALWFTEANANKIGRITTAGQIREFAIPTADSRPTGIVTCTTECPPHGGVWFMETNAGKIGKFISPL